MRETTGDGHSTAVVETRVPCVICDKPEAVGDNADDIERNQHSGGDEELGAVKKEAPPTVTVVTEPAGTAVGASASTCGVAREAKRRKNTVEGNKNDSVTDKGPK